MEEGVENKTEEKKEASKDAHKKDVTFPGSRRPKKRGKKIRRFIIILVVLAVVAGGAWFIFSEPKVEEDIELTPTPFEQVTPTSTEPEIDRQNIKIQVLNGTGIEGAASDLQEELEELGYSDVETGNAGNFNYEETQVTFDLTISDSVSEEVINSLEAIYENVDVDEKELDEFDIEIITGYTLGYTPAPTKKPTPTSAPTPTVTVTGTLTPTPTATPTPTPTPTP